MPGDGALRLVVGQVSRAHGVRGEVSVDIRTDDPQLRFAVGADLATEPASAGPLQVEAARPHGTRLLVRFRGVTDRTAAEALLGVRLLVDVAGDPPPTDPDDFNDRDLVGLRVRTTGGAAVGAVSDVLHLPGQDLLAVARDAGGEVLVPFVRALVPTVDLAAGELVLDPPPGLLHEDEAEVAAPGEGDAVSGRQA